MIEALEHIDQQLLLLINGLNNPFFDEVMWIISEVYFGVPFYILFIYLSIKFFGVRSSILIILSVVIAVSLADLSAKYLFKEVFLRYRPTHNLLIKNQVHLVNNYRGGMYGFVSSHAANMFAVASAFGFYFRMKNKYLFYALLFWAALIAYSRMYLGVHYPSDVFVGSLLGALIGFLSFKISKKYVLR